MDFKDEIYEIAFGANAINRDFDELEVIERIQSYSDGSNPILIEDAWCETEQLNAFLTELSDADLIKERKTLIESTVKIMKLLDDIGVE